MSHEEELDIENTSEEESSVEESSVEEPGGNPGNREAARYRHRAKEAETANEELRQQLAALQRHLVAQALPTGVRIDVLDALGVDPATLLDADGVPSRERITIALEPIAKAIRPGGVVPNEGTQPTGRPMRPSFEGAFRPQE